MSESEREPVEMTWHRHEGDTGYEYEPEEGPFRITPGFDSVSLTGGRNRPAWWYVEREPDLTGEHDPRERYVPEVWVFDDRHLEDCKRWVEEHACPDCKGHGDPRAPWDGSSNGLCSRCLGSGLVSPDGEPMHHEGALAEDEQESESNGER